MLRKSCLLPSTCSFLKYDSRDQTLFALSSGIKLYLLYLQLLNATEASPETQVGGLAWSASDDGTPWPVLSLPVVGR